jgi:MFS family permease
MIIAKFAGENKGGSLKNPVVRIFMNPRRRKDVQAITSLLIVITLIVFVCGFAYKNQYLTIFGMFCLGLTLIVHAPLSLITVSRWRTKTVKTRLARWGEIFFAVGQFIFGILATIGALADLTTDYLTSGRFWQQVSNYPFLFFFSFGTFCALVGIAQIFANLQPDGEKLSDKLARFRDILQGIIFLLFGLIIAGVIAVVKLLSAI